MKKPKICVTIVENNLEAIKEIEPEVDFFEIRMDLIGQSWPELVKSLRKPWIACNRSPREGGKGSQNNNERVSELLSAIERGARIVDIEQQTDDLSEVISMVKTRALCLLSFHDMVKTPPYRDLVEIVKNQIKAGADICKIVTNAQKFDDNLTLLRLIRQFPEKKIIAFSMGETGRISRILSPLAGGYFTYASMAAGKESAPGQIPVRDLIKIYRCLG